jgi:hypothetical protein
VGHAKTIIVNYPMEQVLAMSVRRRGLTELEVGLTLKQEAHPFVFRRVGRSRTENTLKIGSSV